MLAARQIDMSTQLVASSTVTLASGSSWCPALLVPDSDPMTLLRRLLLRDVTQTLENQERLTLVEVLNSELALSPLSLDYCLQSKACCGLTQLRDDIYHGSRDWDPN